MGKVRFADPIQDLRGKINTPKEHNGAIWVFRQKCYGVNGRGKPLLGPKEHYAMHRHEGKWSEKATNNRKSFGDFCAQACVKLTGKRSLRNRRLIRFAGRKCISVWHRLLWRD